MRRASNSHILEAYLILCSRILQDKGILRFKSCDFLANERSSLQFMPVGVGVVLVGTEETPGY